MTHKDKIHEQLQGTLDANDTFDNGTEPSSHIKATPEQMDEFQDILDQPAVASDALRNLLTEPSVIDEALAEAQAAETEHEAEALAAAELAEFEQTVATGEQHAKLDEYYQNQLDEANNQDAADDALAKGILADDPDAVLSAFFGINFGVTEPDPETGCVPAESEPAPVVEESYEDQLIRQDNEKRLHVVADLRAAADFIEAHTELPPPSMYSPASMTYYGIKDKTDLVKFARAFGTADKEVDDYSFRLIKKFGSTGHVTLQTYSGRDTVCKRVKIGEEVVPAHTIPAQPAKEEEYVEAHTREVFKWECPSLLAIREGEGEGDAAVAAAADAPASEEGSSL